VSSAKPATPEPTEIADRYVIEKKLGAGAFGTVYKARDKKLRRLVAIKTIRLEGLAASSVALEDLLKRFEQEAEVAARVQHQNIVALWDIGTWEGLSYISMEFVDGVGLDRVIQGSGKMAVERAASIGAQIAEALEVAHQQGVIHRDIKPANIMILPGDRVKVTDFGIAKLTDSAEHLTVTGSLLGTPSYMSPEQARGGKIDGRSDLFSVGCILYEMVAGQRAFRGESITALLFKIITEEPPSLRELDPTVSDAMLRIIGKALSKAPETRYQTGRELADDLIAITQPGFMPTLRTQETPTTLLPPDAPPGQVPTLQALPTAQQVPTIASQATKVAGQSPTVIPPIPPPVAATVLTPAPPKPPAPPPLPKSAAAAPAPRPQADAQTRRKGGGAGIVIGLVAAGVLLVALIAVGAFFFLRKPATDTTTTADVPPTTLAVPPTTQASQTSTTTAEATPLPQAATPQPTGPPATQPTRVAASSAPPPTTARTVAPPPTQPKAQASAQSEPPPAGNFSHLDDFPEEGADGRAAGDALAAKYRSDGSSSYTTGKFRARGVVPRGVTLEERPAVATLLHLNTVEQAFHSRNSKWGTLKELHDAGLLVLDVPVDATGFKRGRYAFRLTVESDGFRAEAVPQAPIGRAFVVDDVGKVRFID
jgi:serine/threonine protein kinase